ncbi:MAG: hypothetical protein J6X49_05380 [Victivallales bacterium]|nr:hypothetical protein [Victivallales bacterium]
MKKAFLVPVLYMLAMLLCCGQEVMPVWFEQIKAPSGVSREAFARLTKDLHKGLKEKKSARTLSELAPEDASPRIVFVTIGEDKWPCRSYIGTGYSLRDALEKALDFLYRAEKARIDDLHNQLKSMIEQARAEEVEFRREVEKARREKRKPRPQEEIQRTVIGKDWYERDKDPGAWTWLKLEVVQYAKPAEGFQMDGTKIALGSLVGLAFSVKSGFAFTPSQMTGRCLLTEERFLALQQVGNFLADTLNLLALKNWMELCSMKGPHAVSLFELDSYFTDGETVTPLYRGHPYPKLPSSDDCLSAATDCGKAILACLDKTDGTLKIPFPDWFPEGENGHEELGSQCELVIAYCRLAMESGDGGWLEAAKLAFKPIAAAAMRYGKERQCLTIVEDEELPEGSLAVPRKISHLRTNALATLAMDEMATVMGEAADKVFLRDLRLLTEHVARQAQPLGGFLQQRIIPTEEVKLASLADLTSRLEAEALATLAVHRGANRFKDMVWMDLSDKSLDYLVAELKRTDILQYPLSPWLTEALICHYRNSGDYMDEMARLMVAADAAREARPILVDHFGIVKDWPSMTAAAEHSWVLAALADRFGSRGESDRAKAMLHSALPYLVFQSQARMDFATASALARPMFYLGFFRDHLEDFGFDLSGQATQMLSLLRMRQILKTHFGGNIPPNEIEYVNKELASLKDLYDVHPSVLLTDLLVNDATVAGQHRDFSGVLTDKTKEKVRGKDMTKQGQRQKPVRKRKKK